jgi:hypothetical protein
VTTADDAVLYNPDNPPAVNALKETLEAAKPNVQVAAAGARAPDELAPAFAKITQANPGAFVVLSSPIMSIQAGRIAEFANIAKLPSVPRQILKDIPRPPKSASRDD